MNHTLILFITSFMVSQVAPCAAEPAPVEFTVKLETVMKLDDGKFFWFHPHAAAIPTGCAPKCSRGSSGG